MSNTDFLTMVESHPDMAIVGHPRDGTIRVAARNGRLRVFDVEEADLQNHGREELLAVFFGKRQPMVMTWMSRIVGYYSTIRHPSGGGWNKSKLAELADRHKGDYSL